MANGEHVDILRQGGTIWNDWRRDHPNIVPDLSGADLRHTLIRASDLKITYFRGPDLRRADLRNANLRGANLEGADLALADLSDADLSGAYLVGVYLNRAGLREINLSQAILGWTTFADNDLSTVIGLESVNHTGPSSIGIDTIYRSKAKIPEKFLRDSGAPDNFITYAKSLVGQALEFYSCFISYSHKDEEFAKRLHSHLRNANIRVWFAPEDIRGGQKLYDQIEQAIQIHDRLLIVLSESSLHSEWVITEIRNARKIEVEESRRKLFPIRLVDFETIQKWKCFDADHGKDLAIEVREYFIPDFSNWKDHDSFEKAVGRLLRDLKAEEAA